MLPRAYPYGIYDLARNSGFVNVGTDHDTGAFAVASIRGWWRNEGRALYWQARSLLITADSGGSNGSRLRLWKLELQKLADETGLSISVCHFPPGTSKWNKVEHRLFSFISSNWRGEPLRDYETIVNLISRTTTAKGLQVTCRLDRRKYPTGRKVTDEEIERVNLTPHKFHGEWNYSIHPSTRPRRQFSAFEGMLVPGSFPNIRRCKQDRRFESPPLQQPGTAKRRRSATYSIAIGRDSIPRRK